MFVSRVHDSAVLPRAVLGFRGISTRGPLLNEVAPASDGAEVVPKAKGDDAADAKPKLIPHKAQHHDFPRALARVRNVKTSMKKLNLVAQLVRRAHVDSALLQLALTNKKTAKYVRKLIHEAKFNAVAMGESLPTHEGIGSLRSIPTVRIHPSLAWAAKHPGPLCRDARVLVLTCAAHALWCAGMDPEQLLIDEVRIGRSTYLKRIEFKGRGKTGIRRKPYCHINVFVREIQPSDEFAYAKLKRHRPRWKRLINEAKERLRQTYTDAPPRSQIRRRSVLLRRSEE